MELKKYQIGKNHFEFVCDDFSTSRNWGHKVTLLKNNYQLQQARITYYNRTWENYKYQTCMLKAIEQEIKEQKEYLKENYKDENNIYKMGKKDKQILENIIANNENIQVLLELREKVRGNI